MTAGVDGFADRLGIDRSLAELLGAGTGTCLEIGSRMGVGVVTDLKACAAGLKTARLRRRQRGIGQSTPTTSRGSGRVRSRTVRPALVGRRGE